MYAIIEDSGTQIRVSAGDVLDIDLRKPDAEADAGSSLTFDKVLVIGDEGTDDAATIGTPYIAGATVTAESLGAFRAKKVDVIKFKRRKGYRRKIGHRQSYLRVKIGEIKS